jgi:hypothetical protein
MLTFYMLWLNRWIGKGLSCKCMTGISWCLISFSSKLYWLWIIINKQFLDCVRRFEHNIQLSSWISRQVWQHKSIPPMLDLFECMVLTRRIIGTLTIICWLISVPYNNRSTACSGLIVRQIRLDERGFMCRLASRTSWTGSVHHPLVCISRWSECEECSWCQWRYHEFISVRNEFVKNCTWW